MARFILHWLVTAVALGIAPVLLEFAPEVLVIAALVLGFVNAVIRPILVLLTLPLTVLTLGLFYLVVNGAAFGLAAALVPGFSVASLDRDPGRADRRAGVRGGVLVDGAATAT